MCFVEPQIHEKVIIMWGDDNYKLWRGYRIYKMEGAMLAVKNSIKVNGIEIGEGIGEVVGLKISNSKKTEK